MKKILFIINPVSGSRNKDLIQETINKYIDHNKFEVKFVFTKYATHATELAANYKKTYDIIVAVGGDGTVNEVGTALVNTNIILAIIPTGSGNGLARFLNISTNIRKAVNLINKLSYKAIDVVKINDLYSFNVSGIGFDAYIGNKFQASKNRGFWNYVRLTLKEFPTYKAENYKLIIDDKEISCTPFLISFANSGQFGNNAYIAPKAKIDDGEIDVVIFNKFPAWRSFELAFRLFDKTIHKTKYTHTYKASTVKIINDIEIIGHVDGEPELFNNDINIEILEKALNVVC